MVHLLILYLSSLVLNGIAHAQDGVLATEPGSQQVVFEARGARYQLDEIIDSRPLFEIRRGKNLNTGQEVVAKIWSDIGVDDYYSQTALHEYQILETMDQWWPRHKNIIQVEYVGNMRWTSGDGEADFQGIVMEPVKPVDQLQAFFQLPHDRVRNPLLEGNQDRKIKRVETYCRQGIAGLAWLWDHGVAHGDVKLSNVGIERNGNNFHQDFHQDHLNLKWFDFGLTGNGVAPISSGTLFHRAPENLKGLVHKFTPAADLYAFFVTVYQLITGEPPLETYRHVWSERYQKPTDHWQKEDLLAFEDRVAKDPELWAQMQDSVGLRLVDVSSRLQDSEAQEFQHLIDAVRDGLEPDPAIRLKKLQKRAWLRIPASSTAFEFSDHQPNHCSRTRALSIAL